MYKRQADRGALPVLGELREAVKDHLPAFCAPRRVVFCDELPRTTLGKLKREELAGRAD